MAKPRPPFFLGLTNPANYPNEAELALTFYLARELRMTVAELEDRISPQEFRLWSAFLGAENAAAKHFADQAGKK